MEKWKREISKSNDTSKKLTFIDKKSSVRDTSNIRMLTK
jgi:hypothetical protein